MLSQASFESNPFGLFDGHCMIAEGLDGGDGSTVADSLEESFGFFDEDASGFGELLFAPGLVSFADALKVIEAIEVDFVELSDGGFEIAWDGEIEN